MVKMASKRGAVLLIWRFPDLMVGVLATAPADRPGYCEVKWVVGGNGGAPTIRASGWRGLGCGLINAGGRTGTMGSSIKWSFGVLQLNRETSCVPAAIESAIRRPRVDPATFATELVIIAVWGFGDMGKRARDSMIRDTFISAQRNCGLRRHLDGVSSDTPIRDIVDSCRVWESHSDREPSSDASQDQDSLGESDDSRKLGCLRTDLQELLVCSGMDSRVPVSAVGVSLRSVETPRKVGKEDGQLAPLEAISSLVTRLS